ncbi:hypothetical protein BQ8794_240228 [Mesorhizobium prunaredense]|uniref:Uncharacterized protein n=1 Tax=Mesorhizobium prunaredense TaxID=1631249 RepID=A0A1R3V9T7_9HYPH|nr:hypothetical protein [Mesorhizobium prunaredense]SIT56021.1 hypothetical protein BQ8794_240228 [Mesorhizobium prunaredense]
MKGVEAYHLTGSDDYQSYVAAHADADQSTPAKVARHYADKIRTTLALLDCEVHSFLPRMRDDAYGEFQAACSRSLLSSTAVDLRQNPALFDAVQAIACTNRMLATSAPIAAAPLGQHL